LSFCIELRLFLELNVEVTILVLTDRTRFSYIGELFVSINSLNVRGLENFSHQLFPESMYKVSVWLSIEKMFTSIIYERTRFIYILIQGSAPFILETSYLNYSLSERTRFSYILESFSHQLFLKRTRFSYIHIGELFMSIIP